LFIQNVIKLLFWIYSWKIIELSMKISRMQKEKIAPCDALRAKYDNKTIFTHPAHPDFFGVCHLRRAQL
jgi:hypothetical protein